MKSKVPMNDLARLIDAMNFSAQKHRVQRRKDVEESAYINHPIAVTALLAVEVGVTDLVTLQAAILHDTIEDTKTTFEELVARFGMDVADVVMEVTDDKSLPKGERKLLQVTHAPNASPRAALLKFADKICNLRDIVNTPPAGWSVKRKQEYFDWAKQVVDALPVRDGPLRDGFDAAFAARPQ
jgi:guanosine-3',5'-bis(diphosphate) 3'-pyrophosphohydrolase